MYTYNGIKKNEPLILITILMNLKCMVPMKVTIFKRLYIVIDSRRDYSECPQLCMEKVDSWLPRAGVRNWENWNVTANS